MVLYNIAQSLKLIDKGISESLVNKEKCPALIEACKIEIDYAKKNEKDEEKKKNIIETHEKQIEQLEYDLRQNDITLNNYLLIRSTTEAKYFSGIKKVLLFIYKLF
ncbi:MAG: hypothetical protein VW270_22710 [Candidatus Poseidoniales archaeon]